MAKTTEEGIQRGMHLLAAMSPGGERYLWTVSQVIGKHKIRMISHSGDLLMEADMSTHHIGSDLNDVRLVNYRDSKEYENTGVLEVYDLEKRNDGPASG